MYVHHMCCLLLLKSRLLSLIPWFFQKNSCPRAHMPYVLFLSISLRSVGDAMFFSWTVVSILTSLTSLFTFSFPKRSILCLKITFIPSSPKRLRKCTKPLGSNRYLYWMFNSPSRILGKNKGCQYIAP